MIRSARACWKGFTRAQSVRLRSMVEAVQSGGAPGFQVSAGGTVPSPVSRTYAGSAGIHSRPRRGFSRGSKRRSSPDLGHDDTWSSATLYASAAVLTAWTSAWHFSTVVSGFVTGGAVVTIDGLAAGREVVAVVGSGFVPDPDPSADGLDELQPPAIRSTPSTVDAE